ncbi:hypothetical protein G6L46_10920 [Agrobacterium rhizogenes]|uniref:hypothetical protein n=1 Tax=Rhizobium rhizogenes TaxID=359 RepID=UPI001573EE79|nr:hypothetical protein [Rhizobium rhizogenes]NTF87636.1 hypothetical protein [Rhizobium rhizogenes]
MTSTETHKWVFDTIFDKAAYDIRKSTNPDVNRLDDYIAANAFIATVQLRNYGATCHIRDAQRQLEKVFGKYHASELRKQCFENGKVTRRNKKFQPLAFIAFDIEGSRQNGFSTATLYPHGHGIVLFHERTLDHFKEANTRYLTLEGGYTIPNPTPGISLFDLKPVGGFDDLSRYLAYSLKLEGKLQNGDTNYAPYNFYPTSSVDFPFWQSLPLSQRSHHAHSSPHKEAAIESKRLRALHPEDRYQGRGP